MTHLTASAFATLFILALTFDALPWSWLMALVVFFLAQLGALWALAYSRRNEAQR